jgi:hypothetical protein
MGQDRPVTFRRQADVSDNGMPSGSRDVADLRASLDRHERARRRLEMPTIAGLALVGLLITAGARTHVGLFAAGFWILALAAVLLYGRWMRDRTERGTNPRGPAPHVARVRDEPAVAFRAPVSRMVPFIGVWLLLAVPVLAGAVGAFLTGRAIVGVVLTVVGLWCVSPVVGLATGRISAGGVWLTPSAVVVREPGAESAVRWVDLESVTATDTQLLVRADASAGSIHRHGGRPWLRPAFTANSTSATVDTRWLAVDAPAVARVIEHYRDQGDLRDIGVSEGQATRERLIRG